MGLPPWHSAATMFVRLGIRSFQETQRYLSYSLQFRINGSLNLILCKLNNSDAAVHSFNRKH